MPVLFYTAHFGNAVDHPDITCIQKMCLLHTRANNWNISLPHWGPLCCSRLIGSVEEESQP